MMKKDSKSSDYEDFDISEIPSVAGKGRMKVRAADIPEAVIKRLPRYFRFLRDLINSDVLRVSSRELSEMMDVTASQIRQDLSCFGGLGQQGYGYKVMELYTQISEILGVDKKYKAVLIGSGGVCDAIAQSTTLEQRGIILKAVFDARRDRIGKNVGGHTVLDIEGFDDYCRHNKTDIAFVELPQEALKPAVKMIKDAGIKGICNFSQSEITENESRLFIQNVNAGDSLMLLTYDIKKSGK